MFFHGDVGLEAIRLFMGNRGHSVAHIGAGERDNELELLVRLLARAAAAEYVQGRAVSELAPQHLNGKGHQ